MNPALLYLLLKSDESVGLPENPNWSVIFGIPLLVAALSFLVILLLI